MNSKNHRKVGRSKVMILRLFTQVAWFIAIAFTIISLNFKFTIIVFVASLISGAWYCGWLCPLGSVQEWLGRLGNLLLKGKRFNVSEKVERWLVFLRYGLFLFGLTVWIGGIFFAGIATWISQSYVNFLSIISGQLSYLGVVAFAHVGVFLFLSIFIDRPFCRYFCTQGAQYGVLSLARIIAIRRNRVKCIDCKLCDRTCPVQVNISTKSHVRNPQCNNCFKCITACPVPGVLQYGWAITNKKRQM